MPPAPRAHCPGHSPCRHGCPGSPWSWQSVPEGRAGLGVSEAPGPGCWLLGSEGSHLTLAASRRGIPGGCSWPAVSGRVHPAGHPGWDTPCVHLDQRTSRGSPGRLTWRGGLGVGAGLLGAGWDAGDAEEGSQECDHEGHNERTLNPGGGTRGHTGLRPQGTRAPCPFSRSWALTACSQLTRHPSHLPRLQSGGRDMDPQGTFIRGREGTDSPVPAVSEGGRPWGRDAEPQRGRGRGLEWAATV